MRKSFELSKETAAIAAVFRSMALGQQMTWADLSKAAGFNVVSTTPAYHSARRVVERDNGVFIGSIRGVGCYRGTGEDMAGSLEPLAKSMRRIAKKSIDRADLAIANNLNEEMHSRVSERRARASIIFSTSAAPMPTSNRKRVEAAIEAPRSATFDAIRNVV